MDRVIPFSSERITNPYGNGHNGVDLGYRGWDESQNQVYSNCYGEVVEVVKGQPHSPGSRSWGNYVLVKHLNGWHSRYCHLQDNIPVNVGDKVDSSTRIGTEGTSGDAEYRHLHFEVSTSYSTSTRINPTPYLTAPIAEEPYKIKYRSHVQGVDWQSWVGDGETSGTTGKGLRLEALQIDAPFEVKAKAHIQEKGWVDYGVINKDTIIGTTGEGRRLEALCLKGNFKYRVHIQDIGWTAWTNADGIITLGTVGQRLRIEAIEIVTL